MPTPFSDPALWQIATFIFMGQSDPKTVDDRGNIASAGTAIALTLKMKPMKTAIVVQGEAADKSDPVYECRLVAIDGDYEAFLLPSTIRIGDIGEGKLNDQSVKATIKSVAQSSVSPLVASILGSSLTVEINYRVRRGSQS